MLADPANTIEQVTNETGLAYDTLRAIYEREQIPIDAQRQLLALKISHRLRRLVERVEESAPTMKPRDAVFGVSVFTDKLQLLTSSATSHSLNFNVNASVDLVAQFEKLHAEMGIGRAKKRALRDKPEAKNSSGAPDNVN
jgi:hypothetical protein